MELADLYRKIIKKLKLVLLYFCKILFVRNKFRVGFLKKVRANFGGGFLADQWVLYDLNSRRKKEYLSEFDWYKSRYMNEPFDYMLNNKVIATEVLRQYIRVPEIFFVNNKGTVYDSNGDIADSSEILAKIKQEGRAVIKPTRKGKGNDVNLLSWNGENFFLDQKIATEDDIKKRLKKKDWYVSENITQHEYASKLYPDTVNTIRIVVIRNVKSKEFEIFFAVQRIGRASTVPVDNASRGGLVSKVDLETGELSSAYALNTKEEYAVHPDNGSPIEGTFVPDWHELKDEILSVMQRLPYMELVAWDVIKMEDGTNCICEANTSTGVNILQLWGGQRNSHLADLYRKHGVIK